MSKIFMAIDPYTGRPHRFAQAADGRRLVTNSRASSSRLMADLRTQCDCDDDTDAVEAMTTHSFLPKEEQLKLNRARERAARAIPQPTQRILNSAADRVDVEPLGIVAAIRARGQK